MRGFKEINWKTAKGMMADTNFLSSLKNMDVDGITQPQVRGGTREEERLLIHVWPFGWLL